MRPEHSEAHRPIGDLIGVLAVDVRQFSKHDDVQQQRITDELLDILKRAADRAQLPGLWENTHFTAFRGDGYLVGLPQELVAAVVDRYFDAVQAELRSRLEGLRAAGVELRLRTSLHVGPMTAFDALVADSPTGRFMVKAGRMLDSKPVRALLDHSDPEVTLVATVLSADVMEHAVLAGRTKRRPSEFVEAPLRVEGKEYSGIGYLRVPVPSGGLLKHGLLHGQPEPENSQDDVPQTPSAEFENTMHGPARDVVVAQEIDGGITTHSLTHSGGVLAHGDHSTAVGGNQTNQEFSGTFTTQGDSNFGPDSGRRGEPR